jgi:hypothetical protein
MPLTGPAIMRKGAPKPETTPAPAKEDWKAAIVTATPKRRRKVWADDGQETPPEIKALIERMMRPAVTGKP